MCHPSNPHNPRRAVLALYSALFMRFAWMVKPRNYLLAACHVANESAQLTQLYRKLSWEMSQKGGAPDAAAAAPPAATDKELK